MEHMQIQLRHDTASAWEEVNPVLARGELGVEADTFRAKFGDGERAWRELPYLRGTGTEEAWVDWGNIIGSIEANAVLSKTLEGLEEAIQAKASRLGVEAAFEETAKWVVPRGAIIMWAGAISTIPTGWALCDGTNGTPNLIDRFISGIASADTDPGEVGGSHVFSLDIENLPKHSHTAAQAAHTHMISCEVESAGAHSHYSASGPNYKFPTSIDGSTKGVGSDPRWGHVACGTFVYSNTTGSSGAHEHTLSVSADDATPTITVSNTGSGSPIDNRPAFFSLAFIMKL